MPVSRVVVGLLWSASGICFGADNCGRLEAGTGDHPELPHAQPYTALAARMLRVDLDHDVVMIAFVDNAHLVDPAHAIALTPRGKEWSLTYVVDKGRVRPSPPYRASVAIAAPIATRVAQAWQRALDDADDVPLEACLVLDGKGYAFSAGGRKAHASEPRGLALRLVEMAATLKDIVLDSKQGGRSRASLEAQLERQLSGLESESALAAH